MTFQGDAEKAAELYSSVFREFLISAADKYGEGEECEAGMFKQARVSFSGHDLIIFDSPPVPDFSFVPSMSLFVNFDTREELELAYSKLSSDGTVMMPPDDYGFSKVFAWIAVPCGVSWQLNLP